MIQAVTGPFGDAESVAGSRAFGDLLRAAMRAAGVSQTALAGYLTKHLPEDQYWDASAIRLLLKGQRRVTAEMFVLLLDRLPLDRDGAYEALNVWPQGLSVEDVHRSRRRSVSADGGRRRRAGGTAGQAVPSPSRYADPPGQDPEATGPDATTERRHIVPDLLVA